ncbi:hypothetical protein K437DRAFT_294983 [Tilletiaria anomala UBC 951]|uniref:Putative phospholipase n=1 Tax=Tilletiaria anomala (strain ATCC 24038 / CBS 436.72 / UBC 951) TaxID=1037660 RepID=A0A066VUK1_TILAU|nr:uncharacterized protein K437DRAFT_294983 [Tilletiaria anomala UBC 951]KDN43948.1 hypothetical protein K437DRAFT_294983 [Tilletiaria anomala UBC 951]
MPLSAPTGPYLVSTLEIEVPVREARTFSASHFRLPSGKAALKLQTVLFTLYYPYSRANGAAGGVDAGEDVTNGKPTTTSAIHAKLAQVGWLGSSRLKVLEGLLKYAGISKYFALPAVLPAYSAFFSKLPLAKDQPLLSPPSSAGSASTPSQWPVAVFSHGLGGMRTTYSQYCASLASHGVVVAAVEHRDRTCPYTTVSRVVSSSSGSTPNKSKCSQVEEEGLIYMNFDELQSNSAPSSSSAGTESISDIQIEEPTAEGPDMWSWRRAQLALRRAELLEVHHVLRAINASTSSVGSSLSVLDVSAPYVQRGEGAGARLSEAWSGRLQLCNDQADANVEAATLIGHSFGAATAVDLVMQAGHAAPEQDASATSKSEEMCPFGRIVLLDPWLEPLQSDKRGRLGPEIMLSKETYVINSEAFTIWVPHMKLLRSVVQRTREHMRGKSWLLTLSGTKHTDFSDFPFLISKVFSSKVEPIKAIRFFTEWTLQVIPGLFSVKDAIPSISTDAGLQEGVAGFVTPSGVPMRGEIPNEVVERNLGEPKGVGIWNIPVVPSHSKADIAGKAVL